MASDSIEGAFMVGSVGWKGARGSKWTGRAGNSRLKPGLGHFGAGANSPIKGLNIGADNWSVEAEEEGLENRHNFQVTQKYMIIILKLKMQKNF